MEISGFGMINPAMMHMDSLQSTRLQSGTLQSTNFDEILRRVSAVNAETQTRPGQSDIDRNSELFQLCLELETFLVKNLLSSMRNTVQKSGFIDDSFAGRMYEDMLWDEKAKDFTKNAGFGLAEQAYRQLSRL